MITDRNLKPGTRLVGSHKKLLRFATVLEGGNFLLDHPAGADPGDHEYKSLSAAAMAITGNSVNGWRFWSVEGDNAPLINQHPKRGDRIKKTRAVDRHNAEMDASMAATAVGEFNVDNMIPESEPEAPKRSRKARAGKVIQPLKGDPDRYFCVACQQAYPRNQLLPRLPEACPEGHRNDDPEFQPDENLVALQREIEALPESTIA